MQLCKQRRNTLYAEKYDVYVVLANIYINKTGLQFCKNYDKIYGND